MVIYLNGFMMVSCCAPSFILLEDMMGLGQNITGRDTRLYFLKYIFSAT